jgi:hypothetical protein
MALLARFEAKYIPEPNSGCWLWTAYAQSGKPQMWGEGTYEYASRLSWKLHKGHIPGRQLVLHKCDTPLCVNPEHLFLGTNLDNSRDMVAKGRVRRFPGETHGQAKLTDREAWEIKQLQGYVTVTQLAKSYGVSRRAIWQIHVGRNWKHLLPPDSDET